jgi:hypothetical protein
MNVKKYFQYIEKSIIDIYAIPMKHKKDQIMTAMKPLLCHSPLTSLDIITENMNTSCNSIIERIQILLNVQGALEEVAKKV